MNGVVMPEQRHRVDASLVPRLGVMGFVDGTVVRVSELDVRLSVVGKASVDELLSGLHLVEETPPLSCVSSPKGEAVA